jgi:hypothetical protein
VRRPYGRRHLFAAGVVLYLSALVFGAAFFLTLLLTGAAKGADLTDDLNVYAAESAYQALALVDMGTTLDIRHRPGMYEENPILGRHPNDARVVGYFAIEGASHALVTHALVSAGWTKTAYTWEALGIGLEAGCVAHNYSIGLKARF